jgi:DNA-directed RNA polymerase specialized sigma24 family protein
VTKDIIIRPVKPAKNKNYYVSNPDFYELLVAYKLKVDAALAEGTEKPRIPEAIGRIFMKIARRYSEIHRFVGYPFREDMIAQAVLVCVTYVDSFNPEKSKNPLAYFTQCCHFAFIDRIDREKRELYTRFQLMRNMNVTQANHDSQSQDSNSYDDAVSGESEALYQYMNHFLENYNPSKTARKKAADEAKQKEIDDAADDEDEDLPEAETEADDSESASESNPLGM